MTKLATVAIVALWILVSSDHIWAQSNEEPATSIGESAAIAEMKALEIRVSDAIQKAIPAIVAIDFPHQGESKSPKIDHVDLTTGSGVIISADGLILSQWHVSHKTRGGLFRIPGDEVEVVLQDGRHVKAELLGAVPVRDLSLLRIVESGEYPHLSLAKPNSVTRADWVLKLGHPFGYRASRGATARLGRVLYTGESLEIVADCLTFAGDSGGPLINLDGEVIGIIEGGSAPVYGIWNLPERSGYLSCYASVETITRLMPRLQNPIQGEKLSPDFKVTELAEYQEREPQRLKELYGDIDAQVLFTREWTQGEQTRAKWQDLTRLYSGTVVEVLGNGRRVAYGTVVGADGWILTKASEVPGDPSCKLADGRICTAKVAGADSAYDLALLKIEAQGLTAIDWSVNKVQPAGKFLAAPDGRGGSIGVGIVCVGERALEGPFPLTITKAKPHVPKPTPPEVLGKMIDGKGLRVERVKDGAAQAGIVPGDILISLNGKPVRDHDDLGKCVEGALPGDTLPIVVERHGQPVEISLKLREEPYVRSPGAIARYRNLRADDFPFVFEHDIPLTLDECGGPLIDLNGKAIGITIARVGVHGCMAIPADVIAPLVRRLKGD